MKKKGFTLLEIVFAMAILAVAALSVFMLNRSSNQQGMDSYYEFLAFSLAREPIEVFRGFGYENLRMIVDGNISPPAGYQVNRMQDLEFNPYLPIQYPAAAAMFKRMIELEAVSHGQLDAIKIKVTVAPRDNSRLEVLMRKRTVSLVSLIMERPK
jgi:prepilin-type N-terminal cleavage/methylation domain-containing protein